ncbi:replication-associated recombination protein A [Prosthecochloris sp. SCSIO W1103]|uniref:replication-associated recombination protein A n=1 Tax=Prosthecochloris sp. SCSIO W1103 TaxID=2992244 RepID=UPI00223D962F|nr:replication-associated recombination protein A [Prosthecochloris sp. SCSIO W1103]UZJ38460.1 replication-associated recombination protein A [Prosthecochloris sp. SCSIO W1103]
MSHMQDDLFGLPSREKRGSGFQPLAERVRPKTLEEMYGQEHLIGADGPLKRFLVQKRLPSMIFWGPPGSGKTTLAEICAYSLDFRFDSLSAVDAGVKEVRKALELAESAQRIEGRQTLLFIDEIHRFNKAQQDSLLHAIEQGIVVLIGATTENPSFEVNPALMSRMQVYILEPLGDCDIEAVVRRAFESDSTIASYQVAIDDWDFLLRYAGGDARKALNALEAALSMVDTSTVPVHISRSLLEKALQKKLPVYDKKGESHYDIISAFIKSMRGSDPDAALFWLAKMLDGGEDPKFIARRMVIFASEDIGNADPYALTLAVSVFHAVEVIGLPEARINLAQGVTYLAGSAKSNASYRAINDAQHYAGQQQEAPVPMHLRNAPTKFMKESGYGKGYKYPHDYPEHFVKEKYMPEGHDPVFYHPTVEGREKFIKERLEKLWKGRY